MVPKFANPHALSHNVELTTRFEIATSAGVVAVACDEESHSLKRDLDSLLRDTWVDALAKTPASLSAKRHRKTGKSGGNEDEQPLFRLVSSMKRPQYISLQPKPPPPPPISRGPDCEDDEMQAKVRGIRALSVAVEFERPGAVATPMRQVHPKSVTVETKVPLASAPFLPSLLVIEEARTAKRTQNRHPQVGENSSMSPHEPRPSCIVLPVTSAPDKREAPGKYRRKAVKQRPAPAYWRPSPDMYKKCMGYALGYPSSWAPDRPYVRDAMKRGVKSS